MKIIYEGIEGSEIKVVLTKDEAVEIVESAIKTLLEVPPEKIVALALAAMEKMQGKDNLKDLSAQATKETLSAAEKRWQAEYREKCKQAQVEQIRSNQTARSHKKK